MSPASIMVLLFACLLILVSSLLYIFVVVPSRRKEVRRRLDSLPEWASGAAPLEGQGEGFQIGDRTFLNRVVSETLLTRRYQLFVAQSGSRKSSAYWLTVSLILAVTSFLVSFLFEFPILIGILFIGIIGLVPTIRLAYKRYRRFSLFERQLPDALDILARAVRAGYAFTSGLLVIADEMSDPIAQEFRKTYEQQNLGLPLRDALYNLSVRVPLPDVRVFVSTLQIQNESGGNLAEVLDKLATIVRERFRLLQQVRIYAAEGKMSMYILLGMAPFLLVAIYLVNPGYIARLFTDPDGLRMLQVVVVLQVLGFFVIRRLVNLKV